MTMKKSCILILNLLFAGVIVAQEKLPNPKIGKNETEVSAFIFEDESLVFGGEFVYRLSVKKKWKAGAGVLYGADYAVLALPSIHDIDGYGAAFADIMLFSGHREKWCFGSQIGYGIYNDDKRTSYSNKTLGGIYYSVSANYRAILSKKLLLTNSLFIGRRTYYSFGANLAFLVGFKAGIVF
jgi:hypothetical protein